MRGFHVLPLLLVAAPALAAPPFAGDPNADAVGPKPEVRQWGVRQGDLAVAFLFEPGIPSVNQVTTISAVPERTGGSFSGARMEGASLQLVIKDPDGKKVGTYVLHAYPLSASKYGTHFTPTREGIYSLELTGKSADGSDVSASLEMPVDVWPLPKELQGTGAAAGGARVRGPIRGPVSK